LSIRRTRVLVGHSLRRIRAGLIVLAVLLAAFQFLLTQVAAYLRREGGFSQLSELIPDFVRTAAGSEALAFMSFSGVVSLGYFHPIVMTALVGLTIAIATELTSEIESRFVDLSLARPLHRHMLVTRTLIVLAVAATLMLASMIAGTSIGLSCCVPADVERPPLPVLFRLAISLATIMACWGGVALAIGTLARRRSVAAAISGVLALAFYLLDYLGRAWDPAAGISRLSPFHYFEPMTVMMTRTLSTSNVLMLIAGGAAAVAVGYVAIARRDI
jgi:ABC-type transport system involved in multi-copper enzyme maturation permease subunit